MNAALIQRCPSSGEFINPGCYSAWYGFQKRGIETRFFTWPELKAGQVQLDKEVVVVGGIEAVRLALSSLGYAQPVNFDYPACLEPIFHRQVKRSVLAYLGETMPVFVKPYGEHKLFPGHTVSKYRDLIRTASCAEDTEVWMSGLVEFVSEYRYSVNRGKIVGAGCYNGDPTIHPNTEVIRWSVDTFEASGGAPIAYNMDLGVLSTGETALVEVNDGFAFGPYGLDPIKHSGMLEDRWSEMTNASL